jgi:hypothetical protein
MGCPSSYTIVSFGRCIPHPNHRTCTSPVTTMRMLSAAVGWMSTSFSGSAMTCFTCSVKGRFCVHQQLYYRTHGRVLLAPCTFRRWPRFPAQADPRTSSWHARAALCQRFIHICGAVGAYVERGDGGAVIIEGRVELLEELPW